MALLVGTGSEGHTRHRPRGIGPLMHNCPWPESPQDARPGACRQKCPAGGQGPTGRRFVGPGQRIPPAVILRGRLGECKPPIRKGEGPGSAVANGVVACVWGGRFRCTPVTLDMIWGGSAVDSSFLRAIGRNTLPCLPGRHSRLVRQTSGPGGCFPRVIHFG